MSPRARVAALAPGLLLALALYAGEATAQNVCRGGAHTGSGTITCTEVAGSSADISVDPGSVNIPRIHVDHRGSGDITVRMKAGVLTGSGSNSILAERRGSGKASIEVSGGTLTNDVFITTGNTATGNLSIGMSGGSLSGRLNINRNGGTGNGRITVSGDATIRQTQVEQFGVGVVSNGLGDELSIHMTGGSVEATGARSAGFFLRSTNNNAAAAAAMSAVIEGGSIRTRGSGSSGVWFSGISGSRDASFRMEGGSIVTEADNSRGVYFALGRFGAGQTAFFRMTGGSIVAEGLGSHGLSALTVDLGSVDAMTGAGAEIEVPFAVGMEGRLTNDASATGRLVFAHGGAVSARDAGVLAWAARSSGYTMGPTPAADAARTMPMIHVTSSGDITTGASVTDAFIRNRIAGADETLSTAEQAVLSAITEGDSGALTTALAALPDADYDADWKAEAEDLRRKRAASSAAPTGNGPLAHRAAEEILGLSRAGVRAYALSHTAIVDHIRAGNALSTEERAALDAVLTKGVGSELETALTALTGATYTTAWKNTVRQFAATYNAGDIRVDVTGGAIDAEGNGVEALYAVPHDSNGAIAVSVADGARVTGGAHGIHVRGAGAGTGGLRAQSVTVNGVVTGGGETGAGVHMADGGRLKVGKTGRVSATSGVGVLSDGAGNLHATVEGTVEGDVRIQGGGKLTLDVREGGAVTGTVRDPVGPLTVAGSIGRLLYSSGGTVTVTRTGALTGVEVDGKTEAIRAESGDLDLTVAGEVAGDLRAPSGGVLRLNVQEGGTVAGTVHDPVGPLTVAGSIGRLLYSSGGAVTVTRTGALTGVEVDGKTEAIRAESGDLDLTVEGEVTGDLRAPRGGVLRLNVQEGGTVAGTVHDPVGPLMVAGSIGRVLYSSGGAVTVTGTGRLAGVEVGGRTEALGSESGDLSLTVADKGMVTGDVQARGDNGRLTLDLKEGGTISGTAHDPVGPLTVAGSIGRLLYSSGGAVTVTRTGALTGVEVDGRTEAVRTESGNLDLTVAGRVAGDLRAPRGGVLRLNVQEGGAVAGTAHDPVGPLTVAGSIGRLLYSSGGAVTVARTGRLTGVDGVALRSEAGNLDLTVAGMATGDIDARGDGDLTVSVSGTVDGDIFGRGAGEHTVTVARGGSITGTVDLDASTVTTDGSAGRVLLRRGGDVAVGATGRLTGVDGVAVRGDSGDLGVTVAAMGLATGDIDGRGDGDLTVLVAGTVDGDVFGRGAGAHMVTIARGGRVTGKVDLAGDGVVIVEGRAEQVLFERNGAVTVGPKGRIPGIDGVSIESRSGAPAVTIVAAAGESLGEAVGRIGGRILPAEGEGEPSVMFGREGETGLLMLGGLEPGRTVPEGAYDVGVVRTASGALRAVSRLAARTRVYESLPSVLLGMERTASHAERMAAPRASDGSWARVAASRGSWEAAKSTNAGTEYDHRGFSFQAGLDAVLGEETRAGLSVHWRRATAEVSQGGEVEARGAGVGLSATWSSGPFFVDGQAAATLYDVDLKSSLRGRLKDDVGAQGLSAALEAGRMVPVADGVTVTPRARVAYSSLSLSDFDDSVGARVSLDRGRSLTGRAGALAERVLGEGGRIFGSVDVEREFAAETRMSVAGTSLEATGEETRYMVGVGGEHGWEEGRFALRGALGYAASGGGAHDYGGRASLSMRF